MTTRAVPGRARPAAARGPPGRRPALADSERASGALRLEVVTLNAFPYAGFHHEVVKGAVYEPDWVEAARLEYTLDCASVLGALLPDDVAQGSISTVPLAWRTPWTPTGTRPALERLGDLPRARKTAWRRAAVSASGWSRNPGVSSTPPRRSRAARTRPRQLGICLDTCHLAVGFEEGADALRRLAAAGLPVVKVQASAPCSREDPSAPGPGRRFGSPSPASSTRCATSGGDVLGVDDLPAALDGARPCPASPWRVHFHVPVHADPRRRCARPATTSQALAWAAGRGRRPATRHSRWRPTPGPSCPRAPTADTR